RAKVIVASSAAALVSDRAYRPTTSDTSTSIFKKSSKKDKMLKSLIDFLLTGKSPSKLYQCVRKRLTTW
ncbi:MULTISPECIES: hypothetical protein, partial [unclassified Sinorhizobium]|uniref:hypothetical protein n=1 Tax=unclassified Sinorhizobium TaxID=2613772 RepID=UPI0024C42A9C